MDKTKTSNITEASSTAGSTTSIDEFFSKHADRLSSDTTSITRVEAQATDKSIVLSSDQQERADELAASIDFSDPGIEQSYGAEAQKMLAESTDQVLDKVRSKDAGETSRLLSELLSDIDGTNLSGVKKLPIIGNVTMKASELKRNYQKVEKQVDEIIEKLDIDKARLVQDNATLESLYATNRELYQELKIYSCAGKQAIERFRAKQLPELECQAQQSGDPLHAQQLSDLRSRLERFDKRLADLETIGVVSLQTMPQIKIMQSANNLVIDKITTTTTMTIPVWKSQLVIALGLQHQAEALELQAHVDDVTNKMIQQNAERMHSASVEAAEASQRGIVDVETLQKANSEIIGAINDTMKVQRDGQQKRDEARAQLSELENEMRAALLQVNSE